MFKTKEVLNGHYFLLDKLSENELNQFTENLITEIIDGLCEEDINNVKEKIRLLKHIRLWHMQRIAHLTVKLTSYEL